jgi:hypothetical protein
MTPDADGEARFPQDQAAQPTGRADDEGHGQSPS